MVTGAAGFIGNAVLNNLLEAGIEVSGIDCYLAESYDLEVKKLKSKITYSKYGYEVREIDLRFDNLDSVLKNIDIVINCAAMPGLIKSWGDFRLYMDCNVLALDRILNCKTFSAQRFVQASTSSVYGVDAIGSENQICKPFSPYGVSKLAAEHLLQAYSNNFGIQFVILRYFSVYGPNQRPDMAYAKFCDSLLKNKEIHVYGDGSATRSNTFIDDCVKATVSAAFSNSVNSIMNICGEESISVLDAIKVISEELQIEPRIKLVDKRPGDQRATFGDASLARKLINFTETVDIKTGLRLQAKTALESFVFEN